MNPDTELFTIIIIYLEDIPTFTCRLYKVKGKIDLLYFKSGGCYWHIDTDLYILRALLHTIRISND